MNRSNTGRVQEEVRIEFKRGNVPCIQLHLGWKARDIGTATKLTRMRILF
jgi:hypothetical protein